MPSTLDTICLDEHLARRSRQSGNVHSPDFAVPDFLANRNMTDERIDSGPKHPIWFGSLDCRQSSGEKPLSQTRAAGRSPLR